MSMNPDFTGVESRIQELMDSGMTRLEALAKQSYGIQQGYDLNNDGMVTNAEYAEFMRAQEPGTVTTMPVGTPVPLEETDQQPTSDIAPTSQGKLSSTRSGRFKGRHKRQTHLHQWPTACSRQLTASERKEYLASLAAIST